MPQTSKSSIKSNTNEKPAKKKAETVSVAERVARMGLINDWDFVLHLPLRYEDETRITRICDLKAGDWAQIQGTVISSRTQGGRFMQLIASVSMARQTSRSVSCISIRKCANALRAEPY